MILTLFSIFPKEIDTTYIQSDSVIYFANYDCSKAISERCLSNKEFTYEDLKNLLAEINYSDYENSDTTFCNDEAIRNTIMNFFMNKFAGKKKDATIKDSLDFIDLLKIKSKISFVGNYQTNQDSINHIIYKAFYKPVISKNGKYILLTSGDFIFMINMKKNKIASTVALKSAVKRGYYYSMLSEDGYFTAYKPLDAPDVDVNVDSLSPEEKKKYLEENSDLEVLYSKYKIDENGYVVLL